MIEREGVIFVYRHPQGGWFSYGREVIFKHIFESFPKTEQKKTHFLLAGTRFWAREAEGHFQTHSRGQFQTHWENQVEEKITPQDSLRIIHLVSGLVGRVEKKNHVPIRSTCAEKLLFKILSKKNLEKINFWRKICEENICKETSGEKNFEENICREASG